MFFDFPAERRIHLRTTNPIESAFATVHLRTKATKGGRSRAAELARVFKLVESPQARRPAVNAPHPPSPSSAPEPVSNASHLVERPQMADAALRNWPPTWQTGARG